VLDGVVDCYSYCDVGTTHAADESCGDRRTDRDRKSAQHVAAGYVERSICREWNSTRDIAEGALDVNVHRGVSDDERRAVTSPGPQRKRAVVRWQRRTRCARENHGRDTPQRHYHASIRYRGLDRSPDSSDASENRFPRGLSHAFDRLGFSIHTHAHSVNHSERPTVTTHAEGEFAVILTPIDTHDAAASLGRLAISKQYRGDLEATSKGEMIAAREANGSGAYVALERVTGKLQGRSGSFVLLHSGMMTAASQQLTVTVVPGSGTDELDELHGKMSITVNDKKHYYTLDYTLPHVE